MPITIWICVTIARFQSSTGHTSTWMHDAFSSLGLLAKECSTGLNPYYINRIPRSEIPISPRLLLGSCTEENVLGIVRVL